MEIKDNELHVKHKNKEHIFLIEPFLEKDDWFEKEKKYEGHTSLVCYNTEDNFKYVFAHWNKLVGLGGHFSVYFINPFSKEEKRWIVYPQTHEAISEGENTEMGLKSLSGRVDRITQKEVLTILND